MLPILGATLAQQLGEAAVGAQASWRTDCALLGHDGRFALRDHAEEGAQSASHWTASLQLERWQEGALVELGFRDETRVDRVTHAEIVRHSPLSVVLRLQGTPIDRTVMLDGGEGCWAWHDDPAECVPSVRCERAQSPPPPNPPPYSPQYLPWNCSPGQYDNPASCYTTFTSGAGCEANGAGSIRTVADCSAAAKALGLPDETADHISYGGPYCTYLSDSKTLKFNSRANTASCWGGTCICWINTAPPPPSPSPP